jgi:hypothetical protein
MSAPEAVERNRDVTGEQPAPTFDCFNRYLSEIGGTDAFPGGRKGPRRRVRWLNDREAERISSYPTFSCQVRPPVTRYWPNTLDSFRKGTLASSTAGASTTPKGHSLRQYAAFWSARTSSST